MNALATMQSRSNATDDDESDVIIVKLVQKIQKPDRHEFEAVGKA